MKTLKTLMIVFLFGVVVLGIIAFTTSGCSTSKPTEPEATSDPEPIAPKLPVALSEEEAWEKAKKIVRKMWWKEQQLNYRTYAANYFNPALDGNDRRDFKPPYYGRNLVSDSQTVKRIRFNTSGLTPDQIAFFQKMDPVEIPQDMMAIGDREAIKAQRSSILALHNRIGVYLKLSFQYPEKTKPELLELFKEADRMGETRIQLVKWSEDEALDKAIDTVKAVIREQGRLLKKLLREWKKNEDAPFLEDTRERIKFELTGVTAGMSTTMFSTHFEENPQDGGDHVGYGLLVVYLKYFFQYPEKSIFELLDLYREAVKNGETHTRVPVVERVYGLDLGVFRGEK